MRGLPHSNKRTMMRERQRVCKLLKGKFWILSSKKVYVAIYPRPRIPFPSPLEANRSPDAFAPSEVFALPAALRNPHPFLTAVFPTSSSGVAVLVRRLRYRAIGSPA